jgi:hypothetical protein
MQLVINVLFNNAGEVVIFEKTLRALRLCGIILTVKAQRARREK